MLTDPAVEQNSEDVFNELMGIKLKCRIFNFKANCLKSDIEPGQVKVQKVWQSGDFYFAKGQTMSIANFVIQAHNFLRSQGGHGLMLPTTFVADSDFHSLYEPLFDDHVMVVPS